MQMFSLFLGPAPLPSTEGTPRRTLPAHPGFRRCRDITGRVKAQVECQHVDRQARGAQHLFLSLPETARKVVLNLFDRTLNSSPSSFYPCCPDHTLQQLY